MGKGGAQASGPVGLATGGVNAGVGDAGAHGAPAHLLTPLLWTKPAVNTSMAPLLAA